MTTHVAADRITARPSRTRRAAAAGAAAAMVLAFIAGASLTRQPEPAEPAAAEAADDPGAPHAMLAALAGEWETRSTLSMAGAPAAEPDTGRARIEPIIDGRFIAIHETGDMLGEPMSSMKVYGYNNAAGVYEATWIYSGSTAMMRARGVGDPDTGVLTFHAQYASGGDRNERFIITLAAPGWGEAPGSGAQAAPPPERFTMTLVALLEDGSAGPTLETTYTRTP